MTEKYKAVICTGALVKAVATYDSILVTICLGRGKPCAFLQNYAIKKDQLLVINNYYLLLTFTVSVFREYIIFIPSNKITLMFVGGVISKSVVSSAKGALITWRNFSSSP